MTGRDTVTGPYPGPVTGLVPDQGASLPDGTALTEDEHRAAHAHHVATAMDGYGQLTWRDLLNAYVQAAFAESDPTELHHRLEKCQDVIDAWATDLMERTARTDTTTA